MGLEPEELLQLVREDGTVLGAAPRTACHGDPSLLHSVARILVFRSSGSLLLQLRGPHKDICPNLWDTSAAGHLRPDETPDRGARRELAEELGIDGVPLEFLYRHLWRTDVESELAFTYRAVFDGPCQPDWAELADLREWTPDELRQHLGHGLFTPGFEHEWRLYLRFARIGGTHP